MVVLALRMMANVISINAHGGLIVLGMQPSKSTECTLDLRHLEVDFGYRYRVPKVLSYNRYLNLSNASLIIVICRFALFCIN